SVKGPRFVTHRRELKDAGDSIHRFLNSGVLELGDHLGPLLWQFPPFKKFDEPDFGSFLQLLPKDFQGHRLRHVVEVRHDSFCVLGFSRLLRNCEPRFVYSEHKPSPARGALPGVFLYLRLKKGDAPFATPYPEPETTDWAAPLGAWIGGKAPADLP